MFCAAARGLAARRWEVTLVCPADTSVEERATHDHGDYEIITIESGGGLLAESWRLRQLMLDRFVEVCFVHGDRDHLAVALALRLAERGAVVRRLGVGERLRRRPAGRIAARLATTGFLFSSASDRNAAPTFARGALEPGVAEPGVDAASYDELRPITASALGAAPSAQLLACVYSPGGRTRMATVFRTIALLRARHPALRLAIVGPGSDDQDLRMHAASLGITPVVSHLGPQANRLAVLRAADLGWVVAGGDDAAFGCLDLMAMRLPVLAERAPVTEYYVADGIAGVLMPPGDAAATAARVASILSHDPERIAMGNAGHTRAARDFTERAMIDGFENAALAARDRLRWLL